MQYFQLIRLERCRARSSLKRGRFVVGFTAVSIAIARSHNPMSTDVFWPIISLMVGMSWDVLAARVAWLWCSLPSFRRTFSCAMAWRKIAPTRVIGFTSTIAWGSPIVFVGINGQIASFVVVVIQGTLLCSVSLAISWCWQSKFVRDWSREGLLRRFDTPRRSTSLIGTSVAMVSLPLRSQWSHEHSAERMNGRVFIVDGFAAGLVPQLQRRGERLCVLIMIVFSSL